VLPKFNEAILALSKACRKIKAILCCQLPYSYGESPTLAIEIWLRNGVSAPGR
jgi:hypothetical protein